MLAPTEILCKWQITEPVFGSPDAGLINDTYVVGNPPNGILQRVNPIFGPKIHHDIEAITAHIASSGLMTPRLVKTIDGELCVPTQDGAWRLLTYIDGTTIHTITQPQQAVSAGALVGQFHRAVADLQHKFHFLRPGAHDTAAHMTTLKDTLDGCKQHPLRAQAAALANEILKRWSDWDGVIDLPTRVCHSDLKISNIRFDHDQKNALCLLDLDTLSPQTLPVEMGDAWRSWCNPAGEDQPEQARFDIEIFELSAKAWLQEGPDLQADERDNLVLGIERICLELAARFCTDAIRQSYFRENRTRFPEPGTHNLTRSTSQLQVARSVRAQRRDAERIISAS